MPTDPYIAWGIALVVATLYGWFQRRLGFNSGTVTTYSAVVAALERKKITTRQKIDDALVELYEETALAEEDEE